ncbi:patatin-like phospholipase family protein [Xanthomarina sp. F2636L]|uniref:patatin-like phospholipase family protein n=1 Tax=Xanthomarina sp. F2636L TaxID=2996018 RepID=UPI00225E3791|nr:patatin-like phospholipase family protein [Xanthomarina sp. F2636L]MCX7551722.1 patatin-like phospholipase family protein [Xanthomarina sp. F2636L]
MSIGLVLSGGGMRGAAHLGAIKALEEHNIYPTHIAGTSAGAIVGALYASGYSWENILKFFKTISVLDITKYAISKPGLLDANKFYNNFKKYFPEDNFSALKKELHITATNILNGDLAVFKEGELINPILASAAFPGVFSPVKIKDSYYVDGGVLNNFPVELLRKKCDKIIGVYVNGFETINIKELKHSHHVAERAFKLKSVREDYMKFIKCDLIVCPKGLDKFGTFDKKNLNHIFDLGYKTTIEALKTYEIGDNKKKEKANF